LREQFPIHPVLMMGYVNAMHPITGWQTDAIGLHAITRLPTIGIRTNEEIIENSYKDNGHQRHQRIIHPHGHFPLLRHSLFLTRRGFAGCNLCRCLVGRCLTGLSGSCCLFVADHYKTRCHSEQGEKSSSTNVNESRFFNTFRMTPL